MTATNTTVSLEAALSHAMRMLNHDPLLAAEQARQILRASPGDPVARLLLGMAHNLLGEHARAIEILQPLVQEQPESPKVRMEFGTALAAAGDQAGAIAAFEAAVSLYPTMPGAWLRMASLLDASGDRERAAKAYLMHARTAMHDPQLVSAGQAISDGRLQDAERSLRERLRLFPGDIAAVRMLAELAAKGGRIEQALELLERCLSLAPGFAMARHHHALLLERANRLGDALAEVESLLAQDPGNASYQEMKASLSVKLGNYQAGISLYESILQARPKDARAWMSLGHALKAEGKADRAIAAYRRAVELEPSFGSAWWSLANLKTFRFDVGDVDTMRAQLARPNLGDEARLHLEFALGKACEDAREYADAFAHYQRGNAIRRSHLPHDAAWYSRRTASARAVIDRTLFARHEGAGCADPSPIFVVGLPRSGSTLVEQILASHPDVEATMELPDRPAIAQELRMQGGSGPGTSYHGLLSGLGPSDLRALGERYIARASIQRKLGRRFFIDKMPDNHAHVALIQLILPRAKIIDARRHPMACGFSNYKQLFMSGQSFSYDLADIGAYYADYVALMAHFDDVLPGRVHRVVYEDLVADTEAHVRALLDYCGLPFDERCLRFFENGRAVRTASSEQVRQPIYREGVDHWRHFEPWLAPLAKALGPAIDNYRAPRPSAP